MFWGPRFSPEFGSFHSDQIETFGSLVAEPLGVNFPS